MPISIDNRIPERTLREQADYALRYVGDEQGIKRLEKLFQLKYHPDKNLGDPKASEKFKALRPLIDVLKIPQRTMLYRNETIDIQKHFTASNGMPDNFARERNATSTITSPSLSVNRELKDALKIIYDLSDDDLITLDTNFNTIYHDFLQQMFDLKRDPPIRRIFDTHRSFESDLIDLASNERRDATHDMIESIKSNRIHYDSFREDMDKAVETYHVFIREYVTADEFKKNALLVYLRVAFELKQEQAETNFIFNKKNCALALDILLKIPVFILLTTYELATITYLFLTPFIVVLMCAASAFVPAAIALLVWGASVMLGLYLSVDIDESLDLIGVFPKYVCHPLARGIDDLVEAIFDVKFSASRFTDIIYDINRQKASIEPIHGQSSLFSWFRSPSSERDDSASNTLPAPG